MDNFGKRRHTHVVAAEKLGNNYLTLSKVVLRINNLYTKWVMSAGTVTRCARKVYKAERTTVRMK